METYEPRFLSWCKSLQEEIEELEHLISCDPADKELLIKELEELTC